MKYNLLISFFVIYISYCCSTKTITENNSDLQSQKIVNLNGDTLFLKDIVKERSLIFRYSIFTCKSCIDSIFYYIKENEDIIGRDHIYILTYFENLRHFIVTARINQINYESFLIPDNKLNLPEDNPHIPYFLVIDKDCHTYDPFFIGNVKCQKKQIKEYFLKFTEHKKVLNPVN